eukprot:934734-Alexandrium_andersonii.AAC.1
MKFNDKTRRELTEFEEGGAMEKNLCRDARNALITNVMRAGGDATGKETDCFLRGASDAFVSSGDPADVMDVDAVQEGSEFDIGAASPARTPTMT